jgi:hypothetical protein
MDVPCKDCITYAICKGNKICKLFEKCDMILDYVRNNSRAKEAIKIIKPPYSHYAIETIQYNTDIIVQKAKYLRKLNHYFMEKNI